MNWDSRTLCQRAPDQQLELGIYENKCHFLNKDQNMKYRYVVTKKKKIFILIAVSPDGKTDVCILDG